MEHASADELEARLDAIRQSPASEGIVELIVRRPGEDQREVLEQAALDPVDGLVGDTWKLRGSGRTEDGSAHLGMQLTLMNSRVVAAVAREHERWPLAGDQLYVDLDLSADNLPTGTRLSLGSAVVEVTDQLHTGCAKFTERFGSAAIRFVNSPAGRDLRLRGMYARVVEAGIVRRGDTIRKLDVHVDLARAVREEAARDAAIVERAQRIADLVRVSTGRRWVGIYRIAGGEVMNLAWSGPGAPAYERFPADRGLTGAAIASGGSVVSNDVAADPRYLTALDSTGSELIVPVLVAGRVAGTLDVEDERTGAFGADDLMLFERIAGSLADLYAS